MKKLLLAVACLSTCGIFALVEKTKKLGEPCSQDAQCKVGKCRDSIDINFKPVKRCKK